MAKKTKIWLLIIICLVIVLYLFYQNIRPSVSDEDIKVEATLQSCDSTIYPYKEYVIEIKIEKSKDCHVMIYPYSKEIGRITYNVNDEQEDYFIPSSIGSDGITARAAETELRKNKLIYDMEEISFVGFSFPDEAGTYKARMYVDMLSETNVNSNPMLVCVYVEEKLGKQLTWAKIVPVKHP